MFTVFSLYFVLSKFWDISGSVADGFVSEADWPFAEVHSWREVLRSLSALGPEINKNCIAFSIALLHSAETKITKALWALWALCGCGDDGSCWCCSQVSHIALPQAAESNHSESMTFMASHSSHWPSLAAKTKAIWSQPTGSGVRWPQKLRPTRYRRVLIHYPYIICS